MRRILALIGLSLVFAVAVELVQPTALAIPLIAQTPPADLETDSITQEKQRNPQFRPDPDNPNMLRDYGFNEPIAQTGKVTVRGDIRPISSDRLITPCPRDSAPYALAESTNYRVQICSAEYDPWLPKYYIGRAKDGNGELRITSTNANEARQLIFRNAGYSYILYRDSARPQLSNAYLEVYTPSGRGYGEALFYIYERLDRPRG